MRMRGRTSGGAPLLALPLALMRSAALVLLGIACPAAADFPLVSEQILLPMDPASGDRFGYAVAIAGERVAVGAFTNDDVASDAGAAYLFERSGSQWIELDKVVAFDGAGGDEFGSALSVEGDTVMVAGGEAVYVYEWNGTALSFVQKLTAADAAAGDRFGRSIALDGDRVAVGASGDDAARGSVYLFGRDGGGMWSELQKLVDPGGEEGDSLGFSVDLEAGTLVAGAPLDVVDTGPAGVRQVGSASVFVDTGTAWSFDEKLFAAGATTGSNFGRSVAVDFGEIAVGAPGDIAPVFPFTAATGTVFRYDANAGDIRSTQLRVWASDGQGGDDFGASVALDGDVLAVGAPGDRDLGSETGAVYLFDLVDNLLNESRKLTASDAAAGDRLGFWVGASGNAVVAGADLDDLDAMLDDNAGQAYVFTLPEPDTLAALLALLLGFAPLARAPDSP